MKECNNEQKMCYFYIFIFLNFLDHALFSGNSITKHMNIIMNHDQYIYFNYKILKSIMSSKSPIKDYSRLIGYERTAKKEEGGARLRAFDSSEQIVEELRLKLELSLKHNAKLLDENAVLSELVSRLRGEVRQLNEHAALLATAETSNLAKVQAERAALAEQLEVKQFGHEAELRRLLEEVSRLHAEKNDLEILKNK